MKDLSRHIEYLLCNHNSVAIPGIGVFTTEDLQATYYAEECLYLPPVRSVRLSTENTDDDGKLEKRNVKLGKVLWGSYYEILSDLGDEDYLAFPYGKHVKEGAPTVESDISTLYSY